MTKSIRFFVPVFLGLFLYNLPVPTGLEEKGWKLFSIFLPMIVSLVLKPLPMGAVSLIGMLVCVLLGLIDLCKDALIAYSSPVVWMVVYIFFVAKGFVNTRLGNRIAYFFVSLLGRNTLGLGYGIVLTELIIAPFIPSNSARTGGIIFPILRSICHSMDSVVENGTQKRSGSFLTLVCFQGNLITSAMFLTAMAANPIIQSISAKYGIELTWVNWAVAASVPGLISIIIIPLFVYIAHPPEQKTVLGAVEMAREKLKEIGPMDFKEKIMLLTFACMLTLWVFGQYWNINACTTALVGVCILLITKIIQWEDVLSEKEAWNTLVWLSILIMLSANLEKFGFIDWFSQNMAFLVKTWSWPYAFIVLSLIYFYTHYFFASNTAHVTSMFSAFLGMAVAVGTPPMMATLTLAFFSSLFSSMTHYGTSAGVVLFGSGYVHIRTWWYVGFLVSLVNIIIWLGIGSLWWKALGFW